MAWSCSLLGHFHSAEVLPEFVVWSENPVDKWLQLPCFFAAELPASGPGGLWLQADGCCSRAFWVAVEVSVVGNIALSHGWQKFARACSLGRPCTLHFKYDNDTTLYMRVFGEDGRRAGCCPEGDDRGWEPSSGDDGEDNARMIGGAQGSPSFTGSSSGGDSSSGGRGQPPCCHTCLGGGSVSARHRASVKRERESA